MRLQTVNSFARKHNYLIFSFFALLTCISLLFRPRSALASLQMLGLLSLGFVLWSLVHHYFDKSLSLEVMVEYILAIALVIVSVVYFLQ